MAELTWLRLNRTSSSPFAEIVLTVREALATILLLGALVGVLFGSSFRSGMMTDDPLCVATGRIANERGLDAAHAIFTEVAPRPFPVVVYALNYRLYKLNLSGYHLSNALWHLANTLLVLVLAWRFTRSRSLAMLAAALFASHFAHWENAIWIAAVEDIYVGFFILVALIAYDRFRMRDDGRWYAVTLAASLGAFLSKEIAVMLAPMLLLADLLSSRDGQPMRGRLTGALSRLWPFFAMTVLYVAVIVLDGRLERVEHGGLWAVHGRHVLRHPINYLGWMLWPYDTAGEVLGAPPHSVSAGLMWLAFWVARLAMLGLVIRLLLRGSAAQRLLTLWLLLAIAPYAFRTTMFSRYSYVATAMFALLAVQLARDHLCGSPRWRASFHGCCAVFIATNVLLHHVSPSVATYRRYGEAGRPIIASVLARRAEIAAASQVWLIDPPAFAPPGPVAVERTWRYILQLVCNEVPQTRCLTWTEWRALGGSVTLSPGIRVYHWTQGKLQRLR